MGYDIVGDVHGHADELEALLSRMGYQRTGGRWQHPERHLVLVGDLIDRGPDQLRVIDIARRMRDAGNATICMGNHEHNAIGWATEDESHPGYYLRDRRKPAHRNQHRAFLEQVGEDSDLHRELIEWMVSLPLWIEFPEFRVVHACWHQPSMAILKASLTPDNGLTEATLHSCYDPASPAYLASEIILKGLEVGLPNGLHFHDKDGHERNAVRVRWWDRNARTLRAAALCDDAVRDQLPESTLSNDAIAPYDDAKPVFFGHYWLRAAVPYLTSETRACLDFSVAKAGHLVAYRWDGESRLRTDKLVWV